MATTVEMNGSNLTIATGGLSPIDLSITSGIVQSGGTSGTSGCNLIKTGPGSLALTAANTFTGQFQLNQGTLIVDNNQAVGLGTLAIGDGTTIESGTAVRVLANAFTMLGNGAGITDGGTTANNGMTLSGVGTFAAGNHFLTVNSTLETLTFSGTLDRFDLHRCKRKASASSPSPAVTSTSPAGSRSTMASSPLIPPIPTSPAPVTVNSGGTVDINIAAAATSLGVASGNRSTSVVPGS